MDCYRVLLMLLLASSGVWGHPQWNRQSSLSSPLSMGMRFLGNIRNGMTRTFRGLFGGGNQQSKEVSQTRPIRQQQLTPPPPRPLVPVHNIGTQPPRHNLVTDQPSSFFTVLHHSEASTAFPDTQGFTDESFTPNLFLTGQIPFQGHVEEESLPFHQEIVVERPNGVGDAQFPSFAVFQGEDIQSQHSPVTSVSSSVNGQVGEAVEGTSIPFGNINSFNLGSGFRHEPAPHSLISTNNFPDNLQSREAPGPAHKPVEEVKYHQPHTFVSSRSDQTDPEIHNIPEPVVVQTLRSKLPNKPSYSEDQSFFVRAGSDPTISSLAVTEASDTNTIKVVQMSPALRGPIPQKESGKKLPVEDKSSVHINTGIKMRLRPTSNDDDHEDDEVSSYEFGYGVLDNETGNKFYHAEKRQAGLTKGSYKIQLPDGRIQTVTYQADKQGFHPMITYEGTARYPEGDEGGTGNV